MAHLSKSRFIAGWQCPLRLWYRVHRPELATPPDEGLQAVFDVGHRVGELARARYPGGVLVDVDHRDVRRAAARTRELMADTAVPALYEAAVVHAGALTRVDVLQRAGRAWDLVEVKSSTRSDDKEHFLLDVAVQHWILAGAGVPLRRAGLLLLDRDYVHPGGDYDLEALFRFEDWTDYCRELQGWIGEQVALLQQVMAQGDAPDIDIGDHCHAPYACEFWAHCSAGVEWLEHPIENLPNLRGRRLDGLLELGVATIPEIPDDYGLTASQEVVRRATVTGRPWVSPGLGDALAGLEWPLAYLDFEAVALALPPHAGMRPYDQLPFQFSCHLRRAPGAEPEHREYLATDGEDPRAPLARRLLEAVGERGSIVVYSGFERRVIRALAAWLPRLRARLLALEPRLVDLLALMKAHYYHPEFRGSYSIKQVLPVLVPGMGYEGMAVSEGTEAGRVWLAMTAAPAGEQRERMEAALRAYCRHDTLAMVRIHDVLAGIAGRATDASPRDRGRRA